MPLCGVVKFHKGPSIYYVSIISDFFWPTHYVSIHKVVNVSKAVHFLDPPSLFADVINGWSLTPQSVTSSVQSQIDHCENSYFSHIPSIIIPSGHTHWTLWNSDNIFALNCAIACHKTLCRQYFVVSNLS